MSDNVMLYVMQTVESVSLLMIYRVKRLFSLRRSRDDEIFSETMTVHSRILEMKFSFSYVDRGEKENRGEGDGPIHHGVLTDLENREL